MPPLTGVRNPDQVGGAGDTSALATSARSPLAGSGPPPDPGSILQGGLTAAQPTFNAIAGQLPTAGSALSTAENFLANHFSGLGLSSDWLNANANTPLLTSVQGPGGLFFNVPSVGQGGIPHADPTAAAVQLGWQNFPSFPNMDAATAAALDLQRRILAQLGGGRP